MVQFCNHFIQKIPSQPACHEEWHCHDARSKHKEKVQVLPSKHHHNTFPAFPSNNASSVWNHSRNSDNNALVIKKPNQHCLHLGYDMLAIFGIQDAVLYRMLWHFISVPHCIHHDSMPDIRARIRGGSTTVPQGTNLYGALKQHRNNNKYGTSESWFSKLREFLWKFSALWAMCPQTDSPQPCCRLKKFKEYWSEGAPNQ
jgi:hypothetical protein